VLESSVAAAMVIQKVPLFTERAHLVAPARKVFTGRLFRAAAKALFPAGMGRAGCPWALHDPTSGGACDILLGAVSQGRLSGASVLRLSNRCPVDALVFNLSGRFGSVSRIIQRASDVDVMLDDIRIEPGSDEYLIDVTLHDPEPANVLKFMDILAINRIAIQRSSGAVGEG
jgi:hypothetical protein